MGVAAVWWRARATGQTLSLQVSPWIGRMWRGRAAPAAAATSRPTPAGRPVVLVIRIPRLSFPRPRLLDLYVSRRYLRLILLAAASLLVLLYIGTIVDTSEKLFKGQATGWMLAEYLWYSTPQFICYIVPMATLVAVLGTVGALTRSNELIVMRACGVSLYRAALPIAVLALMWSGLLFGLQERVLASANQKASELGDTIHDRPHHTVSIENRQWLVGANGEIYHYTLFDARHAQLDDLSVFETADRPYRLARADVRDDGDVSGSRLPGQGVARQVGLGAAIQGRRSNDAVALRRPADLARAVQGTSGPARLARA